MSVRARKRNTRPRIPPATKLKQRAIYKMLYRLVAGKQIQHSQTHKFDLKRGEHNNHKRFDRSIAIDDFLFLKCL